MTRSLAVCGHGAIERLHGAASVHEKENTMATNTARKAQSGESAKPPVFKLRDHALNVAGWERTTLDGKTFYNVTFERRYRDAKGDWHGTQSFDKSNLLTLAKLADQADTEIARLTANLNREQAAAALT